MYDFKTVNAATAALTGGIGSGCIHHVEIVRKIRASVRDPDAVMDPREYAAGLWIEVVAMSPLSPLPVLADRARVFYQPHPDPRREGWRIAIGVVQVELCRRGPHTRDDIWHVCALLAVPPSLRSASVGALIERQRWAPEWFLRLARVSLAA